MWISWAKHKISSWSLNGDERKLKHKNWPKWAKKIEYIEKDTRFVECFALMSVFLAIFYSPIQMHAVVMYTPRHLCMRLYCFGSGTIVVYLIIEIVCLHTTYKRSHSYESARTHTHTCTWQSGFAVAAQHQHQQQQSNVIMCVMYKFQ